MVRQSTVDHIKFATDILVRLGEELIPYPDQGIIEIVKNAYDADAVHCWVELHKTGAKGGTVVIADDGYGMDVDDIKNGWLVLGRSLKYEVRNTRTPKGRLRVGDKGLGRLAALRMGSSVILKTRPKSERGVEYSLVIDWAKYEKVNLVEDVLLKIEKSVTGKKPGTEIILKDLRSELGTREVERLVRELLLLTDPFGDPFSFHPSLKAPDYPELEKKIVNVSAYLKDHDYYLEAQLNDKGLAAARLLDWKGKVLHTADHLKVARTDQPYLTVPAKLNTWVFILGKREFSARTASLEELRKWLRAVGGVHIYHRGIRVRPYGDPGQDWLDLNLARTRSPEERPGTHTVIGRVSVDDFFNELSQKTDRLGFIENNAFVELRRFAVDAFEWMATVRLKDAVQRREQKKSEANKGLERAEASLDKFIQNEIPKPVRPILRRHINNLKSAAEKKSRVLQEDLQLYRSLATAGTTTAVFAHESAKPVSRIEKVTKLIKSRMQKLLGDKYQEIEKHLDILQRSTQALRSFTEVPLFLLKRDKRRAGSVDVNGVVDDVVEAFSPFFDDALISITVQKAPSNPTILGSVALLEAVITNFLTNTINAFNVENTDPNDRTVIIRTETSNTSVYLKVLDSGPGISMPLDEIWLPGRTTTPGGTGFGLTIVRDAANDLGGASNAIAKGELGGAEFIVRLPLIGD